MNRDHEDFLKKCSVYEWNKWREDNPHEQPNLAQSDLRSRNFNGFDFRGAGFYQTNFTGSTFINTNFRQARLIQTNFTDCNISGCSIYGISAWDLIIENAIQNDLVITKPKEAIITVDNLQIAQFLYLMINNKNLRDAIDAISNKAVLILGNFSPDRLRILEKVKEILRSKDKIPILFNFDKPLTKDLTETVITLANLSKIVIADLTEQRSIPHELASIRAASVRSTVIAPICQNSYKEYGMFNDFKIERNYLDITHYASEKDLPVIIQEILDAADKKAFELEKIRS